VPERAEVPESSRGRRRAVLRERVLDAAREILLTEGVEALTMRRLGERLDYTASALYRHFRDKDALLQALVEADYRAFAEAGRALGQIADPVERLRAGARGYVEFGLTHPHQYRLLFMTPPRGGDVPLSDVPAVPVGDPELDRYAALRRSVEEALATGRFRRDAGNAELLTQALWAAVHGVVSLHLINGSQPYLDWQPAADTAAVLTEAVLRGLAPAP
jgi:AcrR family transcriptional regulator